MRKLTALFVASTLALGAANLAHAAQTTSATAAETDAPVLHHKMMRGPMHEKMFKDLNLTEAQKKQVKDIMKEQRGTMQRPSVDERRALHEVIASDRFDQEKAQAQVDKMAGQNKARMMAHLQAQNKIYNILTVDQKKQFNATFEKHLTEHPTHKGKMPASQ